MLEQMPTSSSHKMTAAVAVLAVAVLGFGGYSLHERSVANDLSAKNDKIAQSLTETQSQIQALSAKLSDMRTAQAAPAPKPAAVAPSHRGTTRSAAHKMRRDDPRWKEMQSKLEAQNKRLADAEQGIASTRNDLSSTKTELSGSIARTHDEVVLLQKKGERNYFEFDLDKSKLYRRAGTVGIKLKKANTKRMYADLELNVDDANLQQKHVNLLQPVTFYSADSNLPVELVINKISKDHIHGYVSEPKYRRSELASSTAADANATNPGDDAGAKQQRQKLELPK